MLRHKTVSFGERRRVAPHRCPYRCPCLSCSSCRKRLITTIGPTAASAMMRHGLSAPDIWICISPQWQNGTAELQSQGDQIAFALRPSAFTGPTASCLMAIPRFRFVPHGNTQVQRTEGFRHESTRVRHDQVQSAAKLRFRRQCTQFALAGDWNAAAVAAREAQALRDKSPSPLT
jgi:hypothetical protein